MTTTPTTYTAAIDILPTLRNTEPDDDCTGMVGPLEGRDLRVTIDALRAAGYDVSDSIDADDCRYIWVRTRIDAGLDHQCVICAVSDIVSTAHTEIIRDADRDGLGSGRVYACDDCISQMTDDDREKAGL